MRYFVQAGALTFGAALLTASSAVAAPPRSGPQSSRPMTIRHVNNPSSTPHVIVVVQENRSVDNLFQGFPGADTVPYGYDSFGNKVTLTPLPLGTSFDPGHGHHDFVVACNATPSNPGACRGNGFNLESCRGCPTDVEYTYVQPSDIVPYTQLATQYALADRVLQPNEGPSFPAHIYLIAGQSGTPGSHWYVAENPKPHADGAQNCLASQNHTVVQIDMTTPYPGVEGNPIYPCIDPPTILDELDQAGITWKYYTPFRGSIWTAPLAIKHLAMNTIDSARVVTPNTIFFSDLSKQQLPDVSYIIPTGHDSDHPGKNNPNGGPAWVASIVNAVGKSVYWQNTTIFVVWDDWGGWFDHIPPMHAANPFGGNPDPYEYGFRVPLLAIGPHAKSGYVSHVVRSADSILTYIENLYGLASLGELDAQTDNLADMFASGSPRRFTPVSTNGVKLQDLLKRPPDLTPVDSE